MCVQLLFSVLRMLLNARLHCAGEEQVMSKINAMAKAVWRCSGKCGKLCLLTFSFYELIDDEWNSLTMKERSIWSCLCHEPEHKHESLFLFFQSWKVFSLVKWKDLKFCYEVMKCFCWSSVIKPYLILKTMSINQITY